MDQWDFWRQAIAGQKPEIHADAPQCGFYKMRDGKDGQWLPVMIRLDDAGEIRARVGDNSRADPHKIWTYCAGNPISKEDAKFAFENGKFPGDAPMIGDNSGDMSLAEQIKDYANSAIEWLKKHGIKDTKSKDMAANYRSELLRLRKVVDKAREDEKRPHLEASRAVDAKYMPLVDEADAAAAMLRDALTAYMRDEERRLEAERKAKWEAEQRAIKIAQEERAKKLADDPIAALTDPEPELPMATIPEPVKVQAGGQRGRKTGLREVTRYVVTDHAKALAFFAESDEVKELVAKLSERAGKAGVAVPGVEKITEKVAA